MSVVRGGAASHCTAGHFRVCPISEVDDPQTFFDRPVPTSPRCGSGSPPYIHDGSLGLESQLVRPNPEQRLGRAKGIVEAGDLASPKVSNIAQTRPHDRPEVFLAYARAQIAGLPG
jgi:hypothetical protein